jgi:hypothetical protein
LRQHKAALEAKPTRNCIICGNPFTPHGPQKCCSQKCTVEKDRKYAREHYHKTQATAGKTTRHNTPATPAPATAPQKSRLDALRAAGVRMGITEPDPVEQRGRVADRERMACEED